MQLNDPSTGPVVADEDQVAAARADSGYVFTDPVADAAYPRIVETTGLDEFPPGWAQEPTERDQAAIDAGNG